MNSEKKDSFECKLELHKHTGPLHHTLIFVVLLSYLIEKVNSPEPSRRGEYMFISEVS